MENSLILGIGSALFVFGLPIVAWFKIDNDLEKMGGKR